MHPGDTGMMLMLVLMLIHQYEETYSHNAQAWHYTKALESKDRKVTQ